MNTIDSRIKRTMELSRKFIDDISSDRKKMESYLTDVNAFTRNRKLPFTSMCEMGLLSVKSQYAAQLPIALGELTSGTFDEEVPVTKGAYSQRRQLIKADLFHDWACDLARHPIFPLKRWHNLIPAAIDGTTVQAPNLYDVSEVFGLWKNDSGETVPILKITILVLLLDDLIMDMDIGGATRSERTAAVSMLDSLLEDTLLILDRGYPSYALFKLLISRNINFIIRVPASFNKVVQQFVKSGKEEDVVTFSSNNKINKSLKGNNIELPDQDPINLRIIRFKTPANTTEILVTTLDKTEFPIDLVAEGYLLRWRVEVDYFFLKNEQQFEVFSGYKAICISQDLYAACVLFNILTQYIYLCKCSLQDENAKRKALGHPLLIPYRSVALSILSHFISVIIANKEKSLQYALMTVSIFRETAHAMSVSESRPRKIRLKRILGKHWTDTNYKDSMLF